MVMTGTLGAALSTAIWGFISAAALSATAGMLLRKFGWPVVLYWLAELAIVGLITLMPQGMRLWLPRAFIQHYLPHTLMQVELRLLVKIAVTSAILGVTAGTLYLRGRR